MSTLFGILFVLIAIKLIFTVGSWFFKLLFAIIGLCVFLAIVPVSLVLLIPLGIVFVVLSLIFSFFSWIL